MTYNRAFPKNYRVINSFVNHSSLISFISITFMTFCSTKMIFIEFTRVSKWKLNIIFWSYRILFDSWWYGLEIEPQFARERRNRSFSLLAIAFCRNSTLRTSRTLTYVGLRFWERKQAKEKAKRVTSAVNQIHSWLEPDFSQREKQTYRFLSTSSPAAEGGKKRAFFVGIRPAFPIPPRRSRDSDLTVVTCSVSTIVRRSERGIQSGRDDGIHDGRTGGEHDAPAARWPNFP